jgi:Protein of unknown function with PCYCGC motif
LTSQSSRQFDGHSARWNLDVALPVHHASGHGGSASDPDHSDNRQHGDPLCHIDAHGGGRMSDQQIARFPRRELLVALAGFGSIGAFAWIAAPTLPELVRAARVSLPNWATTTSTSAGAYRFAVLHPDVLAGLPCFCGCATYQPPHRNLRDCFIRPDGGFEAHAAGCTTCQDEALTASRLMRKGVAASQMRETIVATFTERGPSTDTAALT